MQACELRFHMTFDTCGAGYGRVLFLSMDMPRLCTRISHRRTRTPVCFAAVRSGDTEPKSASTLAGRCPRAAGRRIFRAPQQGVTYRPVSLNG